MTKPTNAELLKTVSTLERQIKKLRKRIAELEAAAAIDNAVRPIAGAEHLKTPLPVNAFPWDQKQ